MKSTKLKFKNTAQAIQSKKSDKSKRKRKTEANQDVSVWYITQDHIPTGPTILLSTQTDSPSVLFAHPESTKVSFRQQDLPSTAFEPTEVQQVFFISLLPGSADKYSIKSCNDKYFGCDEFGVCSCTREAIGLQEEFSIECVEGGVAFRNMYDKYLSIDLVKNTVIQQDQLGVLIQQPSKLSGIRGDANKITSLSTFVAKCQTGYKQVKDMAKEVEEEDYAIGLIKKYSTVNTRNMVFSEDHIETFKKAKRSGKLNETLLNQRETLKSDKFCK